MDPLPMDGITEFERKIPRPMTMAANATSNGPANPDVVKIKLYRNGDVNFVGKELVLNKKHTKDLEQVLQMATERVDLERAARSIRTPFNGTRISDIHDLEDKGEYVVVGYGKFKKGIEYVP